MNAAQRNNNPGNLRYAGQKEALGADAASGFAVFPDGPAGWRAMHRQIKLDQDRELSVREFVYKWAPPSENDSAAYLKFVCDEMNCGPEQYLRELSKYALAGVMAAYEGYFVTD